MILANTNGKQSRSAFYLIQFKQAVNNSANQQRVDDDEKFFTFDMLICSYISLPTRISATTGYDVRNAGIFSITESKWNINVRQLLKFGTAGVDILMVELVLSPPQRFLPGDIFSLNFLGRHSH